jgi:NAD(P)H-dependent FMN reductase
MMKKILAFSGSNSSNSINQQLVKWVAEYATNALVEVVDIRDFPAPIYSTDEEKNHGIPSGIQDLKSKIDDADGIILASPEHNGSIPAVLKNTLDWISRMEQKYMNGKDLLLLSTSPGPRGGKTNLEHLKQLAPWWGANVIDAYAMGSFHSKVENGTLVTEEKEKLQSMVEKMM